MCKSQHHHPFGGEELGGWGEGLPGQASCSPASFGDAVGGGQDAVGLGMEVLS